MRRTFAFSNFKVSLKAVVLCYLRTWFIKSFTTVPKGLLETVNLASETRAHFHLDAKVVADGHPFSLSVNTTHARSRKFIIQALLKNVFHKEASLSGKYFIIHNGFRSIFYYSLSHLSFIRGLKDLSVYSCKKLKSLICFLQNIIFFIT